MDNQIHHTFDQVKELYCQYIKNEEDRKKIEEAYDIVRVQHDGQLRKSGEPYINHLIEVAYILASLHAGPATIIGGLLHDVVEDTDYPLSEIEKRFGKDVCFLVDSVTKIQRMKLSKKYSENFEAEDHKKIFLGMAKDIRVIIIKLADRLHNMRTLEYLSKDRQQALSKETLEVFAPIAHRLGMNTIQRELEDICLSYLEPEEKLTTIQSALSSSIDQLDAGEFEMAQENLEIIGDHILALQDDVTNEKEAYDEIHVSLQSNLDLVNVIGQELEEIMALYANIKDRFGLEDWTHRFSLAQIQMEDLSNRRDEIQKELKQNQRPSVDVVHGYRKFSEDVNEFHDQVKDMKEMLVGASSDESRAKKQLTKLQLILNEVRLNTVTRHLPSISSQFSADLKEGERLIQRVRVVLDHSPLDVQTLNADLQDAIDFVYKLYNNANNLVGVAVMVENAIVFGNRFRSTHAQMDSDLTRAELCFQNGEYTRALKIAIQAIENMHPGIYEKLVAQKDPAVMNQVQ